MKNSLNSIKNKIAMIKLNHFIILAITFLTALFYIFSIGNEDLWYDECFSAMLIKHSFLDICKITAGDSHPPLFYVLLKCFSFVMGNNPFSLRLFSALATLVLIIVAFFTLQRLFGRKVSYIFTVLAIFTPALFSYAIEVRMYTLAAFFITGAFMYGCLALKENLKRDWFFFGLFCLAASYTHYFATMTIVSINIFILGFLFLKLLKGKNDNSKLVKLTFLRYFFTVFIVGVLYLPWVYFFLKQAMAIRKNFWVPRLTLDIFMQTLTYPFNHKFTEVYKNLLPFLVLMVFIILCGIIYSLKNKQQNTFVIILATGSYSLTLLMGVLLSIYYKPILYPRYMLVAIGLLLIAVAFSVSLIKWKKGLVIFMLLVIMFSSLQISYIQSHRFNGDVRECVALLNHELKPSDVFIYSKGTTFGTFCYYFPNNFHFYYQDPNAKGFSNYDAFKPTGDYGEDLTKVLKTHKTVYLVRQIFNNTWAEPDDTIKIDESKALGKCIVFNPKGAWFGFSIQKVLSEGISVNR